MKMKNSLLSIFGGGAAPLLMAEFSGLDFSLMILSSIIGATLGFFVNLGLKCLVNSLKKKYEHTGEDQSNRNKS